MGHRFFQTVHHFHGKPQIPVFRGPVLFRGRLHIPAVALGPGIPHHGHMGLFVGFQHGRQEGVRNVLVDQQGFHGIAGGRPVHLGVHGDFHCHGHIGIRIHIGVTHSGSRFDHRHGSVVDHILDQSGPAPGDHHIHQAFQMDQFIHRSPVRHIDELDRPFGQPGLFPVGNQHIADCFVGMEGFPAPLQDHGIAAFHAQGDGVGGYIGPGFIDDPDDPQGHGHLGDGQPVGQGAPAEDPSHRIREPGHLTDALGHLGQPVMGKQQPVQEGIPQPSLPAFFHIHGIGFQDVFFFCQQPLCHAFQDVILHTGIQDAQFQGSLFCRFPLGPYHSHFVHGFCPLTVPPGCPGGWLHRNVCSRFFLRSGWSGSL